MNLLSEIISKPVLNLYSGKIEGTVINAYFDNTFKKIQYFKIFDNDEEEFLIATSKIYSVGESCLVIKNSNALMLESAMKKLEDNNPVNLEIYSSSGDNLGILKDIELEENFEVKNFITKDLVLTPKNIINIGKIVIINNSDKKIKYSDFKPKIKKIKQTEKSSNIIKIMPVIDDPKIELNDSTPQTPQEADSNNSNQEIGQANNIQPINTNTPQQIQQEEKAPQVQKETFKIYNQPTPQRIVGNGNFLIGRKAIKTIYGLNNEIIIKKDNIINSKNLESAKKHSKLVELTVFSKIKA